MHFLVDECCGPVVARWLGERGHEVQRVVEITPGSEDAHVLDSALKEDRILITSDKDLGARVFERGEPHHGVILLRLADERPVDALKVLAGVLERFGEGIKGRFIVATERRIRSDGRGPE